VLGGVLRDKALARGGIRPLFTDYQLLGNFTAGSYVFTDRFIKKNPKTVRAFVTGVGKAIEWTRATPRAQVVARLTAIIQKRGRKEDTGIVQYFKSFGVAGTNGVIADNEVSRWVTWLDQQGQLKKKVNAKDVYTNEFNPSAKAGS
jgi:ABC-type nitrate/sulfonate/bicarbonate transport system substrate-binding protein